MNLQRFFRVVISLKIIIFHPEFLFRKASQSRNRNRLPKVGENVWTVDRKGSFAWRPTIRSHFFHTRISHVFFREVTVLTASLHAGSFRSNPRVPSVFPIPSSLSDSSRVFVHDDEGVPVARSQNNGKTTIGPSRARGCPTGAQATFFGASSRRREPAHFAHERPDSVAPASRSPRPSFAPSPPPRVERLFEKGTSYERSTANHEQASGRGRPTHGRQAPLRRPRQEFLDSEPMLPEEYEDPDDEDVFLNDVLDQKVAPARSPLSLRF